MSILICIQARMGSTRFPGKVLKNIWNGLNTLDLMQKRISQIQHNAKVVVITSIKAEDDKIQKHCIQHGYEYLRGSSDDLLDRHYQALQHYPSDHIIKIPSDCPLCDPGIIDQVIKEHVYKCNDYTSNYHPATFPDGLDVEICSNETLSIAWRLAKKGYEREHTFPYIWTKPNSFKLGNVINKYGDESHRYRWTLDYELDLKLIKAIYEYFASPVFSWEAIKDYLDSDPQVDNINQELRGVNWYRNVNEALPNC